MLRCYLLQYADRNSNIRSPTAICWQPVCTSAVHCGWLARLPVAMQAVTVHARLGYWPLVLLPAVRVGFSGALSTVSTFVAEVRLCMNPCL